MVDTYFSLEPFLPALEQNALIITANNRLRNHMRHAYLQHVGKKAAIAPRINSLSQWVTDCWSRLERRGDTNGMTIISSVQRQTLWERIIQRSSLSQSLLHADPLAQAADSALRAMELWELTLDDVKAADPILNEQSNTYCWLTWAHEFRAALSASRWITTEQAVVLLCEQLENGQLPTEAALYITGFDDLPPLHERLLGALCPEWSAISSQREPRRFDVTTTPTFEHEVLAAALWSKEVLEQSPQAMIGIIVPDLGQSRQAVERGFIDVFEPHYYLPDVPRYTLPFNFSAGTPLVSTPIIAAAFDALTLTQANWPLADICHVVLSPFISDFDGEFTLRTEIVSALRHKAKLRISQSDVREIAEKLSHQLGVDPEQHGFSVRLRLLENLRRQQLGEHSALYWSIYFADVLRTLNWPGTRRLDSHEHQQVVLWNQVIETFQTLDATGERMDYAHALNHLRDIAGKMPFQAQTPQGPIQILGALEGAGLQFSHCWVMGLHHRQWPATPSPNPFLPVALQRDRKMPHASAERELAFAQALTQHYQHCADHVMFSFSARDNDAELSPSPLIRHYPLTPIENVVNTLSSSLNEYRAQSANTRRMEWIDCTLAPHADPAIEKIRGGASLFKEQALCPFDAFAKLRLNAVIPDEPSFGISAIERGNTLHAALASLWIALGSQQTLLALDEHQLAEIVQEHAGSAIRSLQQERGASLGAVAARLELERLVHLLMNWMNHEKSRAPFRVVAVEKLIDVTYAGIPIRLRVDRIDQIGDDAFLIIDYKTGSPSLRHWQGDRLEEPQLPLYAVTADFPVVAIAFAQINTKSSQWMGWGNTTIPQLSIEEPPQGWSYQLAEWHQQLTQLAQNFLAGHAELDYKNSTALQYAEALMPLNRLPEQSVLQELRRHD